MNAQTAYKLAYQAARLDIHIANAQQSYDYTMYDGFREECDGYNAEGQSIEDWRDAIDRIAYETEAFADHCKQIRSKLDVDPALVELCRKHLYDAHYVRQETSNTRYRYSHARRSWLLSSKAKPIEVQE